MKYIHCSWDILEPDSLVPRVPETIITKPKGWKLPPVGVQRKAATDLGSVFPLFIVCRICFHFCSDHPFDIL